MKFVIVNETIAWLSDRQVAANSVFNIVISLTVAIAFIIFISVDIVKALKMRAHWIPGDILVLSALTIMLISMLCNHQSALLKLSFDKLDLEKVDLWMIHSSRVMLCVLVGYLLPGMASHGSENICANLSALMIAIFLHMTNELYSVVHIHSLSKSKSSSPSYLGTWELAWMDFGIGVYFASTSLISICLILLLLLLGCAYVGSRGIESILAQKIPLILSGKHSSHSDRSLAEEVQGYSWQRVEDEVLRSWIVARAYSPEFIIARSALSSSVAVIVTIQILVSIAGWIKVSPKHTKEFDDLVDVFKTLITILQCVFILIGWVIIGWRCCTAAGYYLRWQSETWREALLVEDFWTRYITDLIQSHEPQLLQAKSLDENIKNLIARKPFKVQLPQILMYMAIRLQWFMVLFSKTCWLLSTTILHNKCMANLISKMLAKHLDDVSKEYSKYKNYLDGLGMLRETPESMWVANRKSIAKARELILQGNQDGESGCQDLIHFLVRRKSPQGEGLKCLNPEKYHMGFKYLCKISPEPLEVENHFMGASKSSWKLTAVSLISIYIHLSLVYAEQNDEACTSDYFPPPKRVKNSLEAYSQAWEIIHFFEETRAEADPILSQAADKVFHSLKTKLEKPSLSTKKTPKSVASAINELAKESKMRTKAPVIYAKKTEETGDLETNAIRWVRAGGHDSIDWKAAAAGNTIYRLCKSIDCSSNINLEDLLNEIECSLADMLYSCINNVKAALVLSSRKWAQDMDEYKIGKALYTAGKARALIQQLEHAPTNEDLQVENKQLIQI
ncbi:hypothetical protein SUGI_0635570 [Cryptomeria japonica]|nr:hypothetical protein SUGI_0635570 [Cryptomeria japonica]